MAQTAPRGGEGTPRGGGPGPGPRSEISRTLVVLAKCAHLCHAPLMLKATSGFVRTHRFYVYELIGDDGLPFYVGRSADPQKRLAQHLSPQYANPPVHKRLVQQKQPWMRLVSGHNTLDEVIHAERLHILATPGLVNRSAGKRPQTGQALKIKLAPEAIVVMDGARLNFSPPIERGSYLNAILTLLRDKYPEIAKEAAFAAVAARGDKFVVTIDSLPPITGCTSDSGATMVES